MALQPGAERDASNSDQGLSIDALAGEQTAREWSALLIASKSQRPDLSPGVFGYWGVLRWAVPSGVATDAGSPAYRQCYWSGRLRAASSPSLRRQRRSDITTRPSFAGRTAHSLIFPDGVQLFLRLRIATTSRRISNPGGPFDIPRTDQEHRSVSLAEPFWRPKSPRRSRWRHAGDGRGDSKAFTPFTVTRCRENWGAEVTFLHQAQYNPDLVFFSSSFQCRRAGSQQRGGIGGKRCGKSRTRPGAARGTGRNTPLRPEGPSRATEQRKQQWSTRTSVRGARRRQIVRILPIDLDSKRSSRVLLDLELDQAVCRGQRGRYVVVVLLGAREALLIRHDIGSARDDIDGHLDRHTRRYQINGGTRKTSKRACPGAALFSSKNTRRWRNLRKLRPQQSKVRSSRLCSCDVGKCRASCCGPHPLRRAARTPVADMLDGWCPE